VRRRELPRDYGLIVFSCVVPPVFLLLVSAFFFPLYLDRYLLPCSIFYYMAAARGFSAIKSRPLQVLVFLLAFLAAPAGSLHSYYANTWRCDPEEHRGVVLKKQEREASTYVLRNFREGDAVLHLSRSTVLPFMYYFRYPREKGQQGRPDHPQLVIDPEEIRGTGMELYQYTLVTDGGVAGHYVFRPAEKGIVGARRVWLVCSDWFYERFDPGVFESNKMLSWLKENYALREGRRFTGVDLCLFEKK
jgi:hypothetical protein